MYASGSGWMVGNPAAWLAQSSENRRAQQPTWRTRIADARKLQSVAEVEAAAAGRRAMELLNAGWTADRVAAVWSARSQQIAVVKRTDEKVEEPQTQSSCGSKRGGGNGSSHRREQSGSVADDRLDGNENSRRLAGHSTTAISKVLKVTDDVAARGSNTATIRDGRRGKVAAMQQQESGVKKTRQGRRAEGEGAEKTEEEFKERGRR